MDSDLVGVRPHRFTVDDYHRMVPAGIFHEDSRIELIRGQIVDMNAIGSPHFGMVNRLTRLLFPAVAPRGLVSVQNPVRLDRYSEPQPDVTVLVPQADDYASRPPGPADVLLLIEVADSSLDYDRKTKAPLYAESGIAEYWIVDLADEVVEVRRRPEAGTYRDIRPIGANGAPDIAALPGITLAVSALFPLT